MNFEKNIHNIRAVLTQREAVQLCMRFHEIKISECIFIDVGKYDNHGKYPFPPRS